MRRVSQTMAQSMSQTTTPLKKAFSDEEKLIKAREENSEITTYELVIFLDKPRRIFLRIISKSTRIVGVGPGFGDHWEVKE